MNYMRMLNRFFLFLITFSFASCATIVSKSSWPFSIQTDPPGAYVTITNKKGIEIFNKRTPTALLLKSGAGFFSKESYTIALSMAGYETKKINVECKINGWYFGNILIGGIIGMLIIDPASGAMYKLDSEGVSETMVRSPAVSIIPTLNIISKDQIPQGLGDHLVKIN